MADFVIVGGGVYGCGVAWELAKRGAEVLLLEAREIASGASGGLGKRGVRANGRDLREMPLMHRAYMLWPMLHEAIGADTGYDRQGHLLLIERDKDLVTAEAKVWVQNQQGIPSELIGQAQLREMEPFVSEAVQAAIFCPLDGIADHTATTRGLAAAAQRLGAVVRENTAVSSLEKSGGRVTAVITTNEERIPIGKTLLLLCNSFVPTLTQAEFDVTLPVWAMLPQVMFTEKVEPMPLNHLIGHAHRTLAMKSHPTGQIMISGGWLGKWNEVTGRGETQPDQMAGNFAEAVATYPILASSSVAEADASRLEMISFDGIPIMDWVPGVDNVVMGVGWSGHGWAIAPAVTELLATSVLTGEWEGDLRPFQYGRFLASR
ncbi:MAG: FAD-binding oxidoreductase [Chloroflexota bacterium]